MPIVSPPYPRRRLAHQVLAALDAIGLRMKLDVVAVRRILPLPEECEADARGARLCIVLASVAAATVYALLPAPRFEGPEAVFAPVGAKSRPGEVEMGELQAVDWVAARVHEQLWHLE